MARARRVRFPAVLASARSAADSRSILFRLLAKPAKEPPWTSKKAPATRRSGGASWSSTDMKGKRHRRGSVALRSDADEGKEKPRDGCSRRGKFMLTSRQQNAPGPALSRAAKGGPAACCGVAKVPFPARPTPRYTVGAARIAKVRFFL
jgi:hypothetical protein